MNDPLAFSNFLTNRVCEEGVSAVAVAESGTQREVEEAEGRSGPPTPGGNADDCEAEGLAGKAIRKTMKTKGQQD